MQHYSITYIMLGMPIEIIELLIISLLVIQIATLLATLVLDVKGNF